MRFETRVSNEKVVKLVGALFAVLGTIFIVAGVIAFAFASKAEKNGVEVEATVSKIEPYRNSDGDTSYRVFVTYTYEGTLYEDVKSNTYTSDMYEGGPVTIVVDPENPRKFMTKGDGILFLLIFGLLGGIFAFIGFVILAVTGGSNKKSLRLMQNGRLIHATIDEIEQNTFVQVNGYNPYNVYASYVDPTTGVSYEFKSKNLYFDPSQTYQIGSFVNVYVDYNNYKNYYVDVKSPEEMSSYDA